MDQIRALAIFGKVAELNSFRRAATMLAISPSVVSQQVSLLEESLGVVLLHRSTRKLTLTAEGIRLAEAAAQMVGLADTALSETASADANPAGTLRITVPVVMAEGLFLDHINEFSETHPRLRVVVHFADEVPDLAGGGYDLALRIGWPEQSAYRTRQLTNFPRRLVASPAYFARHPQPTHPNELSAWTWIHLEAEARALELVHPREGHTTTWGSDRISVNSIWAVRQLARAGSGLAVLPFRTVEAEILDGRIVEVLPEWRLPSPPLYAVWAPTAPRNGLARRLIEFLAKRVVDIPRDASALRPADRVQRGRLG